MANIVRRTVSSFLELATFLKGSGLSKHGELVAMLKSIWVWGMGTPSGQTCTYKVKLTNANEVDAELVTWIKGGV